MCFSLQKNKLSFIDIQGTKITDEGFKVLVQNSLETLKVLRLKNCKKISFDCLIKNLGNKLSCLEELTISEINSRVLDCFINSAESLKKIKFYNCDFNSEDYEKLIPKLKNLTSLRILYSKLTDKVLKLIRFVK